MMAEAATATATEKVGLVLGQRDSGGRPWRLAAVEGGELYMENVEEGKAEGFPRFASEEDPQEVVEATNYSKVPIGTPFSPYASGDSLGSDNFGMVGAKQSPSIQLMGRLDVLDPNRIPSSVFDRTKSNTPMEWSVASNESLFSIHTGKSGDLTSLYSNHLDGFSPPLSGTSPAQSVGVGSSLQQPVESEVTSAQPKKDVLKAITEEHAEKDRPSTLGPIPHSDSTPRFSDCGSVNSYRSFAFPILTVEGRNGSFKGESVQPFEKEQMQQPQPKSEEHPEADTPKTKPVAARRTWLRWPSCFSCRPFCC
ncbi:hypothetical protein B296_00015211 [Ensete ventricosum]|uniref:Uncharacterized protein n=1 Tax=Ensete ventricosum TaxID=4639 RepID=A0A426ZWW5_ENSVE|nr:hypothetical protein B296_00015211 [Ensete ventricosum]